MFEKWAARLRTLPMLLTILAMGTAAVSYTSYRADNRFFSHLGEVVLQDGTVRNGKEACLRFLDFSSNIPVLAEPPGQRVPWWVFLYYRLNPFKPDPRSVLQYGTDTRGPCGSRSRVLAALLEARDIPVRLTSLHSQGEAVHTIAEAKCEAAWAVLDPTYNLFFQDSNGGLMSAADVRDRPELFRKATEKKRGTAVCSHHFYPETYTYDDVYPFNWDAVPFLLPGLKAVLDKALPDHRIQGLFRYPSSYRRPKLFVAKLALAAAFFFFLLSLLVRRAS